MFRVRTASSAGLEGSARGTEIRNVVPLPSSDKCDLASQCVQHLPDQREAEPGALCVLSVSRGLALKEGLENRARRPGSMPGPLSRTRIRQASGPTSMPTTTSPVSVNSNALATRFTSTSRISRASLSKAALPYAASSRKTRPLLSACGQSRRPRPEQLTRVEGSTNNSSRHALDSPVLEQSLNHVRQTRKRPPHAHNQLLLGFVQRPAVLARKPLELKL